MATPYPNNNRYTVEKDNYNFYHSQVRIAIECAFGILLQRFALLRRKLPQQFTIQKTMALVSCLCRVHNFLIERRLQQNPNVEASGAITWWRGEHFDDDPTRTYRRAGRRRHEQLVNRCEKRKKGKREKQVRWW